MSSRANQFTDPPVCTLLFLASKSFTSWKLLSGHFVPMGSGKWTVLDHASNKFPNLGNLGDMFLLMILGISIWNNSPSTDVKFISY